MNLFSNQIRSYEFDQEQLLLNILELHAPNGIDADCTYSIGNFYKKNVPVPRLKFDIRPQAEGVVKAAAQELPLRNESVATTLVDPPFFWGSGGAKMAQRFGKFDSYQHLIDVYGAIINEQFRVLKKGGILIFKCQDICDGRKQFLIHNDVLNLALGTGFVAKDLFLLLSKNRHFHPDQKQQHARKHHCYFWVFRRPQRKKRGLL